MLWHKEQCCAMKSKTNRNATAQRVMPDINDNGNNNAKPLLKMFLDYQKDNVKQFFDFHSLAIFTFSRESPVCWTSEKPFLGLTNHCPWWLIVFLFFVRLSLNWTWFMLFLCKIHQFREHEHIL